MLAIAGADVRVAGSAEDALDDVDAWQPDVLLSALGKGDESFIRELRSLPAERGGCLRAAALGTDKAAAAMTPSWRIRSSRSRCSPRWRGSLA